MSLLIALCLLCLQGCVYYCKPTPKQAQTPVTGQAWQYVPEYGLEEDHRLPPPLGGPYFSMPPAEAPGLKVTPYIGPDGVVFCNEVQGVTVCQ